MTIIQLRVFLAAARLGSFTAAAAAMHMAQPSVSDLIRRLETEWGKVPDVIADVALTPIATYGCECSDGTSVVSSCGAAPTYPFNVVNFVEGRPTNIVNPEALKVRH